uniref:Uncharacterized protein n=1 Tax=Gopherus evgoodei TaxID=1825980 RepID=A0A8C4Y0Z8_9SAUR
KRLKMLVSQVPRPTTGMNVCKQMVSLDRDLNRKGEIDLTEKEEDLSLCLLQSPFLCSPEMYGAERLCRPKSTNSRPAQRLGNGSISEGKKPFFKHNVQFLFRHLHPVWKAPACPW